jgi:hypothetical protein
MALLNPVNALIVPFLFVTTIPLAFFASITTLIAFSILSVRVIIVYLELVLSVLPRPLLYTNAFIKQSSAPSSTASASRANSRSSSPTLVHRRRRRRSSATSLISAGSAGSLTDSRGLGLIPSIGPGRDYEGIGGWRVGSSTADDEAWTSVSNPRLELPSTDHAYHYRHHQSTASISGGSNRLYHQRTLSAGPVTPGDVGYLMMKSRTRSPETTSVNRVAVPNSSRARTPPVARSKGLGTMGDSYFPSHNSHSPKATRRPSVSTAGEQ